MEKKEKNHSFGLLVLRICFTSILLPAIKRLLIQVPNSNLMNLHKKIKSCKNISREEKLDMEKQFFPPISSSLCWFVISSSSLTTFYDILSFILLSLHPLMWLYVVKFYHPLKYYFVEDKTGKLIFFSFYYHCYLLSDTERKNWEEPSSSSPWLPSFFIEIFWYSIHWDFISFDTQTLF